MNSPLLSRLLLLFLGAIVAGCNGKTYPSVSGKVTMDGKAVSSVTVVFTPVGSSSTPAPGPYSVGVTDEQGVFILRTRYDDPGAVAGPHRVGIEYAKTDELNDLKLQLHEAEATMKKSIQHQIDELKKVRKSRIKIPTNLVYQFDVPSEGTSNANFELSTQ